MTGLRIVQIQRTLLIALLVTVFALAFIAIQQEPYLAGNSNHTLSADEHEALKSADKSSSTLWDRTTSDATAFYTLLLVVATLILAVVSVVQAGFLLRTDRTAKTTAAAAHKAADAAFKQAEVAERAFVGLERPFVWPEQFEISFAVTPIPGNQYHSSPILNGPGSVSVALHLRNHGRTPAIVQEAKLGIFIGADFPDWIPLGREVNLIVSEVTLHPNEGIKLELKSAGVELKHGQFVDPPSVFLHGFIVYRDVFEYLYIRKYASRITPTKRVLRLPGNKHNGERRYDPEQPPEFSV